MLTPETKTPVRMATGEIASTFGGDYTRSFAEAIAATGITPPEHIIPDGRLHRFAANGRASDDAGWYVLHGDGIPAGAFGDWRTGTSETWRADVGRKLTPEEEAAYRRRVEEARRQAEEDRRRRAEQACAIAARLWREAKPAGADHPYLTRKGVAPTHTLREIDAAAVARVAGYTPSARGETLQGRLLLVPVKIDDRLATLELIDEAGRKSALAGGAKKSGFWSPAPLPERGRVIIAEGVATALSIREATGAPVVACLSAGNIRAVAEAMRARGLAPIIAADLDKDTGKPFSAAVEAASALSLPLTYPVFRSDRRPEQTDFNDLHQAEGAEAVANVIVEADQLPLSADWPNPQPLTATIEPEAYPLDALPDTIRAAVEEVQSFVQAPVALAASSALSALSLAIQAHVDVRRAEKLHGPVSLFVMTIADSGERKSTCDRLFTSAIRQFEEEQAEAMKPEIKKYESAHAAWLAEREGILSAIKDAGKKGKPTDVLRADLERLQHEMPKRPRVPRLILSDETPEALAWSLAKQWPSAGVLSSEASVVFGSHGMGKDAIMRNLGLLNVLWDGAPHSIGRRTSESYTVRGARLTMGLMVQEATLREYFIKSGGLARGTGFLARFLVAWPESTQGTRFFREAPERWPALSAFHKRIGEMLNQPIPIDDDGALTPAMLSLAPDAKAAWVAFHDAIESELASGGELYDVRDVSAKAADNAARLAALFHVFENGAGDAIGQDSFERASRIVAWHLSEARRFFGELALPAELADAARLDSWLIEHCRRARTHQIGKNFVRRYGPLRDGARLDAAIRELADLDRLRLAKDGKTLTIYLNPALMGAMP